VPSVVVTETAPLVPPAGAATVTLVAVADCTVAAVPLNLTVLSVVVVLKLVPVIITTVPAGPDTGLMAVTVGGGGIIA
jgi:hypothetical protein